MPPRPFTSICRQAQRWRGQARCFSVAPPANAGLVSSPSAAIAALGLSVPSAPRHEMGLGFSDIAAIPSMRSSEVRKLAQAAAVEGADARVWAALASRCEADAERLNYWDVALILQAFATGRFEHHPSLLRLADAMCAKTSHLAPKHVLDVLAVYETFELRPRALYVELFHTLIRLSKSMYAEEVTLTLTALARHGLGNPTIVAHLALTVERQLQEFRLRYLCNVVGAFGAMESCPPALLEELDKQARFEIETVAVQELFENIQAFSRLEFSWRPYEEKCLEEFVSRTRSFVTSEDMAQLASPFEVLQYLRSKDLLHREFLLALCQWCLYTVHRPNVRSERRPTSQQLVHLHDICCEWEELENSAALQDAIRYYVESGGGIWAVRNPQPLRYRKKRRYIRAEDPFETGLSELETPHINATRTSRLQAKSANDLIGLPGLPGLPGLDLAPPMSRSSEAVDHAAQDSLTLDSTQVPGGPRRWKLSKGTTVTAWLPSRKGPRPRVRKPPHITRADEKNQKHWRRPPLWYMGGWFMRPKYHQGVATKRYPWAGVPIGPRGTAWVMRR